MNYMDLFEKETKAKLSQLITSCGGSVKGLEREIDRFVQILRHRIVESFKNGIRAEKKRGHVKVTKRGFRSLAQS